MDVLSNALDLLIDFGKEDRPIITGFVFFVISLILILFGLLLEGEAQILKLGLILVPGSIAYLVYGLRNSRN